MIGMTVCNPNSNHTSGSLWSQKRNTYDGTIKSPNAIILRRLLSSSGAVITVCAICKDIWERDRVLNLEFLSTVGDRELLG